MQNVIDNIVPDEGYDDEDISGAPSHIDLDKQLQNNDPSESPNDDDDATSKRTGRKVRNTYTDLKGNLTMMQKLMLTSPKPNKSRTEIAMATQFDILLPLTKPIIPLCMLITTGQVWNGIVTSLGSSYVLRNYIPKMNYETHHLVCFLFGFAHTILGVT